MIPDSYRHHRLVVGYHGCGRSTAESVLLDGAELSSSENRYDWLGRGIYFWEHGYHRALEFARWKEARGELEEPVVLGAFIHLGRCFDLTDTSATDHLSRVYDELRATGPVPQNQRAGADDFDLVLRFRDCAVLNFALQAADAIQPPVAFQTVRGVFMEGIPVRK